MTAKHLIRFQIILFGIILISNASVFAKLNISIITDTELAPPAKHGIKKLQAAIKSKGLAIIKSSSIENIQSDFVIIAGTVRGKGQAATLIKDLKAPMPQSPEALTVHRSKIKGKPALILCGFDATGLMYAALDSADRISWSQNPSEPFKYVHDICESPDIKDRSLSIYTMQRAYFESRLYDEAYLESYFDMLSKNRFNHFVLILGYTNMSYRSPVFTAPVYPYFFDTEGFGGVKYTGITAEEQKRHIAAVKKMIEIAHERGIRFGVGLWDHFPHKKAKDAIRNPDNPMADVIVGIDKKNLIAYTKVAFAKFLRTFPEIDSLQFRMHWESGLRGKLMVDFCHEIFEVIKRERPELPFAIRAKDVPDKIIYDAVDMGLNVSMATKYWMEQFGMPFHPTHVNRQNQRDRRHGYADLLRYPQRYKIHWRLWNGGTGRVLLWGDPEYVKRFSRSLKIYGGNSFEINEMLALKMNGQGHWREPFELLNRANRYYDWEFERYWHFYQSFGRVSYNPASGSDIWEREFIERFGEKAGVHIMKGLHQASRVLPRIVASSYPYSHFPTPKGWAEMRVMGGLSEYAKIQGSDIQQFLNPAKAAKYIIEGKETAKRWPAESSEWFSEVSKSILRNVAEAERNMNDDDNKEFKSTVTDLKILAYLALYHSNRLGGGVNYNLFKETGDLFALDEAIGYEKAALKAWEQIVISAGDVYNFDLLMGTKKVGTRGHWRDKVTILEKSIANLKKQREKYLPKAKQDKPFLVHIPVRKLGTGKDLVIKATVHTVGKMDSLNVCVGSLDGKYKRVAMGKIDKWQYEARIGQAEVKDNLNYYIELKAGGDKLVTFPEKGKREAIRVTVTDDSDPPAVKHNKIASAAANEDLKVSVFVEDPSGVKWVRLRYRHLTQFEDYKMIEMRPDKESGVYRAEIPGDFIIPKWDMMYFIEVMDKKGNGRMYPDLEKEMPYVVVQLRR